MPASANQIYVNGRFLTQQISGVQAFAREICRELAEEYPALQILVPGGKQVSEPFFGKMIVGTGNFSGHVWEQVSLPRFVRSIPRAVLINLCNSGPLFFSRQAVTIHDLAFMKNPGWFHPAFSTWYRFMVPRLVKKSKLVITVSETVKQEIISSFGAEADKILVLGNKVSRELLDAEETKPQSAAIRPGKFFLMVGTENPRKNFGMVESVFRESVTDYQLVIAGGTNRNFRMQTENMQRNTIRLGYTTPGELKWLYQNAAAHISPSHYEGFGIPNLEAMAFGCPVICSDIPVFREVCGDAAHYFSLPRKETLNNCLHTVLENKMLTESKTLAGKGIFTGFQNQNRASKIINALVE